MKPSETLNLVADAIEKAFDGMGFEKDPKHDALWHKGVTLEIAKAAIAAMPDRSEIPVVAGEYNLGHYGLLTPDSDFFTQDIDQEQHSGKIQVHGDGAKKIAQRIIDALREPKRESGKQESGWVVEKGESQPCSPEYFTGANHPAIEWSDPGDHLSAIRFARKEDAEKAARRFINPRICEHLWGV
jgi:hypothetical protein